MKIISFDLSTKCIGCVTAEVISGKVTRIASAPIIPPKYYSDEYLKSKKRLVCGNSYISCWARPGEEKITKVEKKKKRCQS